MGGSCCVPAGSGAGRLPDGDTTTAHDQRRHTHRLLELPGGEFLMGAEDADSCPEDHEGPIRPATVAPFAIAATAVTNLEFARFVAATHYVTDAERAGWSYVFHLLLHPAARAAVRDASIPEAPWWLAVDGANWACPDGPGSTVRDRPDHPVVHVSYRDAMAYCRWSGTRLPTEVEWEYAARGGLEQARYPWGDELTQDAEHRCNIWQGVFPTLNTGQDGWIGTAPVESYRPNGFGLFNAVGNVWEICGSPWVPGAGTDEPVIRGGSYLCHAAYCNRYRVAARSRTTFDSSTGNMGFRVAR